MKNPDLDPDYSKISKNNGILGPIMVHYSKLGLSGSILIKICIWIKNLDQKQQNRPNNVILGPIMVHYSNFGISGSILIKIYIWIKNPDQKQQNRSNNGILGPIMVHYSKFGISGSTLIKICMWIKNPDLDPDYSKIGLIMANSPNNAILRQIRANNGTLQ